MQSPVSTPSSIPRSDAGSSNFTAVGPQRTGTFDSVAPTPAFSTHASFRSVRAPPQKPEAFESLASLPRSLQRAYGNALNAGGPPEKDPDGRNINPAVFPEQQFAFNPLATWRNEQAALQSSRQGEDVISPVEPPRRRTPPFGQQASNSYRHSTSLLNPPGHMPPQRAPSSAGSFATTSGIMSPPSSSGGRRMPPHMLAFRNAAAANAAKKARRAARAQEDTNGAAS